MSDVFTKGDVIVNKIKIGDIHYEFEGNLVCKSEVLTIPERDDKGYWTWKSKNLLSGNEINYGIDEKYSHYGPKLYTYEAYKGCRQV